MTAYPNPVSGVDLFVSTKDFGSKEFVIYNIVGQAVTKGIFTNKINVQDLQSRMYILQVGKETISFVRKK